MLRPPLISKFDFHFLNFFSYRRELRRQGQEAGIVATDHQLLGNLYDVYFHNTDLKLLLNLLATR
jgi:hypothetical protein